MNYINEAFKKLETLNEEEFSLTKDGVNELKKFKDGDDLDVITVIDPDAEHEDDVQDSYIGKVILDCEVCHSKLYKDPADVNVDEELGLANKDDECPYCYSTEGFKVIGQVDNFNPDVKVETEDPETKVKVDNKDVDNEETNESLEEGYGDDAGYYGGQRGRGIWKDTVPDWARKQGITASEWERRKSSNAAYNRDLTRYGTGSRRWNESIKDGELEEKLDESFENVSIDTGDEVIKVTTEPKDPNSSAESIVPVEDDVAAQITSPEEPTADDATEGGKVPEDGAPADGEDIPMTDAETVDLDADELVEESWNYLGESYLKNVYGNVDSYKATAVKSIDNKMIVEGVIKFTSGKEKQTSFIFESHSATKSGKVKFIGENAQITRGKKAFSLTGSISDKKLVVESLNYNYRAKDAEGKSRRVYGRVKNSK